MSTSPRHGAPGCPCEECLTARIELTTARASDGRDLTGLRRRLDGFKVRLPAPPALLRSVS